MLIVGKVFNFQFIRNDFNTVFLLLLRRRRQRSILINSQFAPSKDLKRDRQNWMISLKEKSFFDRMLLSDSSRLSKLEHAIVQYFISRNEDERRVAQVRHRKRRQRPRRRFNQTTVIGGFY